MLIKNYEINLNKLQIAHINLLSTLQLILINFFDFGFVSTIK
jgi:hypothetical protein